MDSFGAGDQRRADQRRWVQVRARRRRRPDADRLIREAHRQRVSVGLRVGHYSTDAQLLAGAHDANSDLATVGYQDFVKHVSGYRLQATGYRLQDSQVQLETWSLLPASA